MGIQWMVRRWVITDGSLWAARQEEPRGPPLFSVMNRQLFFHSSEQIFIHLFLSSSTEKNSSEHEPYTFCKNSFTL
jgi:hypothetical protein